MASKMSKSIKNKKQWSYVDRQKAKGYTMCQVWSPYPEKVKACAKRHRAAFEKGNG